MSQETAVTAIKRLFMIGENIRYVWPRQFDDRSAIAQPTKNRTRFLEFCRYLRGRLMRH